MGEVKGRRPSPQHPVQEGEPNMSRPIRKLVILALLIASLGFVVSQNGGVRNAYAMICCSACETDPPPLPCKHGCLPDC